MARSRNIKPGFFTNDVLGELPALARLLFAGIWTLCDREGRLEDRPKKIKAEVLPYDECDADDLLQQLHRADFIERYEVDGKRYLQVKTWAEHQNPHMKEAASTIPAPCKSGASSVQAPAEQLPQPAPAVLIPDSLSLDSLEEKASRKRAAPLPKPDDVDQQVWDDWLKLRKDKKASVTLTVVTEARKEAGKAGLSLEDFLRIWCLRGSQGLEASWLKPHELQQAKSFRQQNEEAARAKARAWTGNLLGNDPNTLDMEQTDGHLALR